MTALLRRLALVVKAIVAACVKCVLRAPAAIAKPLNVAKPLAVKPVALIIVRRWFLAGYCCVPR